MLHILAGAGGRKERVPNKCMFDLCCVVTYKRISLWQGGDRSAYHDIPSVAYGLSKLGVNCFTQILAARHSPAVLCANACSPGPCPAPPHNLLAAV